MSKIVRFHRLGGPEVLQIDDIEVREPGAGGPYQGKGFRLEPRRGHVPLGAIHLPL